jgi:hypothetical protein
MIMRYFGGGVGHLGNARQHQVNCEPPDTEPEDSELEEEMEITSDDGGNNASASGPGEVEDIIMNYDSEVENSEQGSGTDSLESDSLSDEGSGEDSDKDLNEGIERTSEDSDDDGYGSL